jgi:hypothetical protein
LLETDLSTLSFNPGFHVASVEHLEWFDHNFIINWNVSDNSEHDYNNPFIHIASYCDNFDDGMDWLIKKNPEYIAKGVTHHYSILARCLKRGNIQLLKRIYEEFDVPKEIDDRVWASFLEQRTGEKRGRIIYADGHKDEREERYEVCYKYGLDNNKLAQ